MKDVKQTLYALSKKAGLWLLILAIGLTSQRADAADDATRSRTFLPMLVNGSALVVRSQYPAVLGVVPEGYVGDQNVINSQIRSLDQWSGKRVSLVGLFINIEVVNPDYNIPTQLEKLWASGYTSFINMPTNGSSYDVASGALDNSLHSWARAYKTWAAKGGGRFAFIAPLQEMNGYWTTYQLDPGNFKLAYSHIQSIFSQDGVPSSAVRWVFAPNGWTRPGDPPVSAYYPGSDKVDFVAFSAYNFGYCKINSWPSWDGPDKVFGESLQILHEIAPSKPVIVAQTATTSSTGQGSSSAMKDQWLIDSYNYLASDPLVFGVIYFNIQKECDWPVYSPSGANSAGYQKAAAISTYEYLSPTEISGMKLP